MARELLAQRVAREMRDRAIAGEPEPGTFRCLRCGRDDCQMFTVLIGKAEQLREMGELNRLDQYMSQLPGRDMKGVLLCPCCSFPHVSGCTHPQRRDCPTCGLPTEPAGSLFGGGPFVRCSFDGQHPASDLAGIR